MLVLACLFASIFMPITKANAQTKTLKLYYLHTGEKNTITYYKNGRYIGSALKKVNWALRDWRRNEPTKMDPKLLDLVWEAYRRSGSKAYIHVISGYRSPLTNEKLRKRGGGQAKKSQHTRGKALDFFLPDVKVSKMRAIGLKMGVGGVGYYPRSGSPFVHLDTGNVRHWPRMSRKQLARVFPKGKTMHVPSDGKPLAKYKVAVAEYKRRVKKGGTIPTSKSSKKSLNFFQRIAAKAKEDEKEDELRNTAPSPRAVKSVKIPAPKPAPKIIKPVIGTSAGPAEIEVASPLTITTPAPVPALPEEEKREFAILAARRVPVPVASPRNILMPKTVIEPVIGTVVEPLIDLVDEPKAEQVVVAELAAQTQPTPVPQLELQQENTSDILKPVEAKPIVATQEVTPEENEAITITEPTIATGFVIPAPTKRPQFSSDPEIQLASLTPLAKAPVVKETPAIAITSLNTPALTANEIEDLRRTVKPKIKNTIQTGTRLALTEENLRTTADPAQNNTAPAIEAALSELAAKKTLEPVTAEPEIASEALVAKLNIPIPTANPRFVTQTEELPQVKSTQILIASLETQTKAEPKLELDPDTFAEEVERPVVDSGLGERTVSLDEFSAPQDNKSSIGQYALAGNFNIRDLNAVQAPAYGRNMIRSTPKTVFINGFTNDVPQGANKGFSGKAIVFKEFARLSK